MKKNKKSEISSEVVLIIPKLVFLVAVLFAVVILVKLFIVTIIDVRQVESNVLVSRLLYSRNGLSYYDEDLKRLYPGVLDLNKVIQLSNSNPNALDNTAINYGADNPVIAARVTIKPLGKNQITVFYNKDRFDKWEPRVLPTVKGGAGSIRAFEYKRYVLAKDSQNLVPASIEFYVIS